MRTQSHISEWDVAEVEMHTRADKAAAQLAELSRHIDMIARLVVAGDGHGGVAAVILRCTRLQPSAMTPAQFAS